MRVSSGTNETHVEKVLALSFRAIFRRSVRARPSGLCAPHVISYCKRPCTDLRDLACGVLTSSAWQGERSEHVMGAAVALRGVMRLTKS